MVKMPGVERGFGGVRSTRIDTINTIENGFGDQHPQELRQLTSKRGEYFGESDPPELTKLTNTEKPYYPRPHT